MVYENLKFKNSQKFVHLKALYSPNMLIPTLVQIFDQDLSANQIFITI